jgi:thiol-disulfide isomerase/thioredoxin
MRAPARTRGDSPGTRTALPAPRRARPWISLGLGAVVTAALLHPAAGGAAPELIPDEAWAAARAAGPSGGPEVELELRAGDRFRLSEHRGSPVVLAFWASWCGPCRKELPALSAWAKAHPGVQVVAVGVDRDRAAAERFLQQVPVDLPVAFDPDSNELGRYGIISMPTTFLFDRAGAFAWQHSGYSEAKGFSELDAALGGLR